MCYDKQIYLKTIYLLEKSGKEVRVTDIANELKKTKPTFNYAINYLKMEKLINYETYGNISLTETGKREDETFEPNSDYFEKTIDLTDNNIYEIIATYEDGTTDDKLYYADKNYSTTEAVVTTKLAVSLLMSERSN